MQVELIGRPADFEEIDDEQADGFSQRRNAALQRSQDSGALTDWSGGSRGSPTRQSCHSRDSLEREEHKYVTVLSVNGGLDLDQDRLSGKDAAVDLPDFVTVLSVGTQPKVVADDDPVGLVGSVCLSLAGFVEETAIIGRQAGQKLGFGLKFDGGNEKERTVDRLYVQCCAEGSPASKVRCSWGRLVEADEIIEIDGVVIRDTLNRQQVVAKLKDGQEILSLKIRHYWDENKRRAIMEQLNNPKVVIDQQQIESSVTRKTSLRQHQQQQERAVDVPEELLIQSVLRNNGKHVWKNEDAPPPVPPRRKRRTKLSVKDHGMAAGCKTAVSRSLSSDQVLINGSRVAASSAVTTPSKPPRNRPQQSRSFNAKHNNNNKESQIDPVVIAPTTLPRTKELSKPPRPEPRERHRQSSVLIVNAGHEPQPAEVYVNLIAEEDKRLSMDAATESESESSSSVSTVVDTWSVSSSSGDPFGDFSEQEEYRELRGTDLLRGILRSENMAGFVKEATPAEMIEQVPSESTLSVLIEPPETFLDNEPTSISPTGHLDASSDSGASSGGSELHLVESDEELRVFQQVETALELGHDCHAISLPSSESDHSLDSGDIKRPESPQTEDAICVPNFEPCASTEDNNEERDKKIRRQDEEGGNLKTKMEHPPNNNKKNSSRSNLNRTPLRSRIPQAVSTPPSSRVMTTTTTTIKNGNSGAAVPAPSTASSHRVVGRPVANNKTSGIVVPKVVKSPVRHHNSNLNISRGVSPTKLTTTTTPNKVSATTTTTASSNLPKSVKPGLPVNSKIPRPSSGAQPKSSPSASSARPLTGTARHPSLLLPRTGVKPSSSLHPLHKSTSRLHLTHNNKEGARLTERPEIIMAATSCKSYVGTSPPSSRLPPDGHEFPGDYMDDTSHSNSKLTGRGRSGSGGNVWRTSHNGRDERSERSVKDKIALFTNEPAPQSTTGRTQAVSSKTKYPTLSCSVDNLSVGRSPMVSPVIRHSDVRTLPRHQLAVPAVSNNKSSTISSVDRDTTPVNLSERSRSLLDVAHYSPPPSNGNGQRHSSELQSPSDKQQRKLSLVNLAADSRRKLSLSNSKLRGLVIPDVVDGATSGCEPSRAVIDLPEIISKDSVMVVGLAPLAPLRSPNGHHVFGNNSDQDVTDSVQQQQQQQKTTPLSSLPWKSNSPSLPKYSPAFKRKELTVLRTPYGSESVPNPPGQQSSSKPALLTSFSCPSDVEVSSPVAEENAANNSDTDGDSAVSSSRSSFSPSGSPLPDRNASEETTALATAASRVLKAQSVEALNRKNVLQSARYSSGGGVGGPHLELAPPPSPPAVPPPAVPTTITTDVKLTVDINPQQVVIPSLASPALRSGQRNNSKLSGDFEQTLRKFSSAEASSRIERSSPRLRLSSSERLEMKTALITDVCSDPASPPGTKTTNPFPRDSSPSTKKIPAVAHHSASKEIKSFRALAERWEAIASEAPASSGSSPPSNNMVTSKKPEVISQPDERDGLPQTIKTTTTTTTPAIRPASTARAVTSRSVSAGVVEIRKAFERVKEELETESNCHYGREGAGGSLEDYKQHHSLFSLQQSVNNSAGHHYHQHVRMSSLDSTTSEDSSLPFGFGFGYGGVGYGSYYGGPFGIGVRDNYGSITSLASSTSLISPQELQQLLDEANQSLEESGTPSHEIVVVVLHRGDVASSLSPGLGITLAGGADYETKEITIHKVIGGSVADRDGRIQKGDRVLSINGKGLKGVTHREALAILKAPRPEVVLVLSRNRSVSPQDCHEVDKDLPPVMIPASNTGLLGNPRNSHLLLSGSGSGISRPPRILESPNDFTDYDQANEEDLSRDPPLQTTLVKDGAGLGFSLEGGKDSPLGDRPLTIKKIFTGGAASKNSTLRVGDQIISVNGCDVTSMSRIEAWNLMKKLPDGAVSLIIRQQITSS